MGVAEEVVEDQPRHEERGEETGQNTDAQRHSESLDRAGADAHQDDRSDEGGQIRVKYRRERLLITVVDGVHETFSAFELFPDTFEDQHVGVHRHADGQDDTGDARQGERRIERRHRTEDQHHVESKSDDRNHSGDAIVDAHEDGDQHQGDRSDPDAVRHVGGAELRVGVKDRVHLDLEGKTAADQRIGDAFGLFIGEAAGDFCAAAGNRLIDDRRTVEVAVEYDGELAADVAGGDPGEILGARLTETQLDLALTELILGGHRVGDSLAGHLRNLVDEVVLHLRLLAGAEFTGGQKFIADRNHEVGLVGEVLLDQLGVVFVDEAEVQPRTHLDEVEQLEFLILGDHRCAERDIGAAGGGDFRFEDLLPLQTLAQNFDRNVAVTVEFGRHARLHLLAGGGVGVVLLEHRQKLLIRHQLKNELHTAVEVESETDRA